MTAPPLRFEGRGGRSGRLGHRKPVPRLDFETGAQPVGIVIVTGDTGDPRQIGDLAKEALGLSLSEVIGELADSLDLAAFDQEEPNGSPVVVDAMRADHVEGAAPIKGAVRHEQPVIAEAILEAALMVPSVDGREHGEGRIALEVAR